MTHQTHRVVATALVAPTERPPALPRFGRAGRLSEPDSVTLQRVALAVLIFVVVVLFIAAFRKARRLRALKARERKKLDGYLKSRGNSDSERSFLDDVVRSSGEPAEQLLEKRSGEAHTTR